MIFCFSGTGNSRHVAEEISKSTQQEIVMITEKELSKNQTYYIKEDNILGFVFPIYWWGIPKLVEKFADKASIIHSGNPYTFAVCTFGLVNNNGLRDLEKVLVKKGIQINATFEVKMVDNYIVGYALADKEKQEVRLREADKSIQEILLKIENREEERIKDFLAPIKPLVHKVYKCVNHQKNFYVNDSCTGCGLCEKECPSSAIQMTDHSPCWKKECSFCLKCIHSCPVEAIQYKKTQGRTRYHYFSVGK